MKKVDKPLVSAVAGATPPALKAVKSAPNELVLPKFGYAAKPAEIIIVHA